MNLLGCERFLRPWAVRTPLAFSEKFFSLYFQTIVGVIFVKYNSRATAILDEDTRLPFHHFLEH